MQVRNLYSTVPADFYSGYSVHHELREAVQGEEDWSGYGEDQSGLICVKELFVFIGDKIINWMIDSERERMFWWPKEINASELITKKKKTFLLNQLIVAVNWE